MRRPRPSLRRWTDLSDALVDLALPTRCAGCEVPGSRLCEVCRAAVERAAHPRAVSPQPCPPGFPPTWAAAPHEGPLARWVVAYKDEGRRDLRRELAPLLAAAVEAALAASGTARARLAAGDGPVLLVPVPTSRRARRARGDHPLALLARDVAGEYLPGELVLVPALRVRRRVADQRRLTAAERAANVRAALTVRARAAARLSGACCLVVDDVATTGATLVEAARALREAGANEVLAATVTATRRRAVGPLSGLPVLMTPRAIVDYRRDMAGQPPRQTRERRSDRRPAGEGAGAGARDGRALRRGW